MIAINIKSFRGQVPRVSDRLLQPNMATRAMNCKITSGRLDPLNGLGLEATAQLSTIRTLFRYRNFINGAPVDRWLTFSNDADVVNSPLANDPQGRIFYTADTHEPRMSVYDSIISGPISPAQWFALGVPNPTQAPSVPASGGTAPEESRAYAYTFVTPLGEESGPSPASALTTGNANGTARAKGESFTLPANTNATVCLIGGTASLALLGAGLLNDVDTAIAAIPDETQRRAAKIEWEYAQTVDRNSAFTQQLAFVLNLSETDLDNLYTQASKL